MNKLGLIYSNHVRHFRYTGGQKEGIAKELHFKELKNGECIRDKSPSGWICLISMGEKKVRNAVCSQFQQLYSILFLPKASDKVVFRYNDLEDTLARAQSWINASQESGVPVVFMNIQTDSLLTKVS
ncbi:hypothetical protein Fot_29548 [Forsythia ovata]|uniref:Uncharacterized protein n=1 Tax=Forsythia ovata TaxID=205694 RepID=A0ABD1TS66_9LAMI